MTASAFINTVYMFDISYKILDVLSYTDLRLPKKSIQYKLKVHINGDKQYNHIKGAVCNL